MIQLGDFFSPEAGQARTRWLNDKLQGAYDAAEYYLGPTGIPQRVMAMGHALNFTDAGDMPEAARASRELWNNPSLEAATDYLGAGIALGVPVLSARMINDGVDVLGSAVDDVMAGYDPNQLNANFRAFHGTTRPFSRFSSDATRFPEDNGAVFFTSERGIAEGFADGDGAPRILEAEFDLNNPLMVRAADGQTPIETWDYSNGSLAAQAKAAGKDGVIIEGASGERMFAVFDANGISIIAENGKRINPATTRGQEILDLLSTNPSAVTDDMLDMGDPVLNARLNEYLWANYDLPMDEASRMARAEGMGFTEDAFHGTATDIVSGRNESSMWFGDVSAANSYAEDRGYNGGGNVIPARIGGSLSSHDNYMDTVRHHGFEFGQWPSYMYLDENQSPFIQDVQMVRTDIMDQGFSGVRVADDYDMADNQIESIGVIDPTQIRSRFARFDPRLAHLRNLNAGLAGIMMGGMALTPSDEAELETYLGGI